MDFDFDKMEDNMDYSFVEPKKKSKIVVLIIFILVLLAMIGGVIYYYFVIEHPRRIFIETINAILKQKDFETINVDYSFEFELETNNKEYKEIEKIINKITLDGYSGLDTDKEILSSTVNFKYKNKELLKISNLLQLEKDGNQYIKLDNLLDKVIKIKLEDLTEDNQNIDPKEYKIIMESNIDALKDSLEKANYKKEIVKYKKEYVKKITLISDKKFWQNYYDNLLDNEEFIKSYSKIENITEEDAYDIFNKEMNELEDITEEISLYLSIIKNDFLKFEYISDEDNLKIIKEDDTYFYEVISSYTTKYRGTVELDIDRNEMELTLNHEDVEEKIKLEIESKFKYTKDKKIKKLDISKATDIEKLTDEDYNKIMENITKNEGINKLLEDLGLTKEMISPNSNI